MDQKFSWSFLGFVISVAFGVVGIYTAFIYQRKPDLIVQRLSQDPVYNLKENISKLDILFDGEDIRKNSQTLTLLTLRVRNNGNSDIVPSSFDQNFLPQIGIGNCKVIKAEISAASNEYLRQAAKIDSADGSVYNMQPVIIEPSEYFDIKALLLHGMSEVPHVTVKGKIAGAPHISLLEKSEQKNQLGFWPQTFGGDFLVQSSRVFVYFLGTLFFVIFTFWLYDNIKRWRETNRRRGIIKRFKLGSGIDFSKADLELLEKYVECGEQFVLRASQFISNESHATESFQIYQRYRSQGSSSAMSEAERTAIRYFDVIDFMLNNGILQKTDLGCSMDKAATATIQQFVASLTILSPQLMHEARRQREDYGSESDPSGESDKLTEAES